MDQPWGTRNGRDHLERIRTRRQKEKRKQEFRCHAGNRGHDVAPFQRAFALNYHNPFSHAGGSGGCNHRILFGAYGISYIPCFGAVHLFFHHSRIGEKAHSRKVDRPFCGASLCRFLHCPPCNERKISRGRVRRVPRGRVEFGCGRGGNRHGRRRPFRAVCLSRATFVIPRGGVCGILAPHCRCALFPASRNPPQSIVEGAFFSPQAATCACLSRAHLV